VPKKGRHSPAMEQFFRAKAQYPDAILFFRMGDFYEMFFEDAHLVSELLDIAVTSRSKDVDGEKIPMAGVPHHSAAQYVTRLLEKGRKVAICEQMADPKEVKGVVPREVVRVITPGLCLEADALDARANNYLAIALASDEGLALATLELSTSELRGCLVADETALLAELARLDAREVRVAGETLASWVSKALGRAITTSFERPSPDETNAILAGVEGADEEVPAPLRQAAAEALRYARTTQPLHRVEVGRFARYDPSGQLALDEVAVRNLELVRTLSGERRGSLLWLTDETRTPMGARLMRRRILAPFGDLAPIRRRHDRVQAFVEDADFRTKVRAALGELSDVERLTTRAVLGLATPRDLGALRSSLFAVRALGDLFAPRAENALDPLASLLGDDFATDIAADLDTHLVAEPPIATNVGGFIKRGVDPALDELKSLSSDSKDVVLALEETERSRTGIGSLKIRYTRVFGYYIEITKSNLRAVPTDYRRKQTVANGERFTTEALDELQAKIEHADERSKALEIAIFERLRSRVAALAPRIRAIAARIAEIDVDAAFAEVAHRYGYVRPDVDDSLELDFEDLRHPIVERLLERGSFVPNDTSLDAEGDRLMVITGPNMAGKSTAMRQVALAVVLAQAGAFVPAKRASIGLCDRIFTRVGASDDLARGQSTFMVEMREASSILRGATRRSFVVVDEIGRGTSTYDGLAIAWAVAEHLATAIKCRAMFATHYHELCELAATHVGVVNFNVAAKEYNDEVVFLHKLVAGSAAKSYGIAVARLAGVPELVLARARVLLSDLEKGAPLPSGVPARVRRLDRNGQAQLDLGFSEPVAPSEVEETLRRLDVDRLRPVDALVALERLKALLD
jgi:DNA mismatch repair protein MutS